MHFDTIFAENAGRDAVRAAAPGLTPPQPNGSFINLKPRRGLQRSW
jgi:hypothetical protein